ncbi:MAG: PGF-pre-PGF domain-containing protein [Candidatus Methanoperedens sp.]
MGSKNNKKQFFAKTLITLFIVSILIISGPGQAISVFISGLDPSYSQGNSVNFTMLITINDRDKFVPMTNITLDITGARSFNGTFRLDGTPISSDPIISMMPVSTPQPDHYGYGYGYGYGYDFGYGYGYGYGYDFGYGYGYGYGYGAGGSDVIYKYNFSINTTSLPLGSYTAVASLNTGNAETKKSFDSAPAIFEIIPVSEIPVFEVNIDILGGKINPGSNGEIRIAILSDATFNAIVMVDTSSVMATFGKSEVKLKNPYSEFKDVNKDGYLDVLLHFKIKETGIQCGDTQATLIGKTITGLNFIGNDSFVTIGCDSEKYEWISMGGKSGGWRFDKNASNIKVIDEFDLQISEDALTSYRFTHDRNPTMFVNITGNTNPGIITASIDAYKIISTLVKFTPEGLVYKNTSIWFWQVFIRFSNL